MKYAIWLVTYGACGSVDVAPQFIRGGVGYEEGLREVARLGFGYCIKPE